MRHFGELMLIVDVGDGISNKADVAVHPRIKRRHRLSLNGMVGETAFIQCAIPFLVCRLTRGGRQTPSRV
jgi:hypothetical protein